MWVLFSAIFKSSLAYTQLYSLCIDTSSSLIPEFSMTSTYNYYIPAAEQNERVKQTIQTEKNAKAQLEDIQQKMKVYAAMYMFVSSKCVVKSTTTLLCSLLTSVKGRVSKKCVKQLSCTDLFHCRPLPCLLALTNSIDIILIGLQVSPSA